MNVTGVPETMVQTLYARAKETKKQNAKIKDEIAVELVEKLDYDFSKADKDSAMTYGVIARTIVIERMESQYLENHENTVVVNIACGLDTRVYRLDTGVCTWYNLDLPETIAVRDPIFQEQGRISTIGCSVLDPAWADAVTKRGTMLFIIEGLTMYLSEADIAAMLKIIHDHFDNAYVMMETTSPFWVKKQSIEASVAATGAKFTWGANSFAEMESLAPGFVSVKDDNILRGMVQLYPIYRLVSWMPMIRKMAEKILIFQKKSSS